MVSSTFPKLRPSPEGHSRPTSCVLKASEGPPGAQPLKKPAAGGGGWGEMVQDTSRKAKAQGRQLSCHAGPLEDHLSTARPPRAAISTVTALPQR